MATPELVIFDCDGVLVDSENLSVAVLLEIIRRAGGRLEEHHIFDRFLGRSMASAKGILEQEFGFLFTEAHGGEMREALFRRFRAELQPVPGVAQALRALPVAACVASSSSPERIRLSLEVTGLLPLLDPHIFSAAMVEHGKPAPDLFLHAARSMGAAPDTCAVVEDSPVGITAAKSAGMRALAFTGGSHHAGKVSLRTALEDAGPDLIFDDMRRLPALLGFPAPAGIAS